MYENIRHTFRRNRSKRSRCRMPKHGAWSTSKMADNELDDTDTDINIQTELQVGLHHNRTLVVDW